MMNDVIFLSGLWSHRIYATMRPISSYQLAWWLRKHNIECQVIEFIQLLTTDELIQLIEMSMSSRTHSICVSTSFWLINPWIIPANIKEAISYIKTKYPNITIVGGGPRVNKYNAIEKIFDVVMTGESEDQLLKYCQEKKYKLSFPNLKFDIVNCEHRFIKKDMILEHESLPMEMGRGCIFKCKFCGSPNLGKQKRTYQRRYDYVADELHYNYDTFGTTNYMFLDDTVNEDTEKIEHLAAVNKSLNNNLTWCGYVRADLIWAHKNHDVLYESGLRNAYFGLETFHKESSKLIGKGWMGTHAKEWIPHLYNDLWKKQVKLESSFIVGLPKETEESMIETAQWIKELNAGYMFFFALDLKNDLEEGASPSEFSSNYKSYNYEIDENGNWYNTETKISRAQSIDLSLKLNNIVSPVWTVGGWQSAQLYNTGLEIDEIKNLKLGKVESILSKNKEQHVRRYMALFTDYYNKL